MTVSSADASNGPLDIDDLQTRIEQLEQDAANGLSRTAIHKLKAALEQAVRAADEPDDEQA